MLHYILDECGLNNINKYQAAHDHVLLAYAPSVLARDINSEDDIILRSKLLVDLLEFSL